MRSSTARPCARPHPPDVRLPRARSVDLGYDRRAMRIEADSVLRYPRDAVWTAYRDDLAAFIEFLPNVRHIEVHEREELGSGVVRLRNTWYGSTELPASLASKLEERFLSWEDCAIWDSRTFSCEWTIEPHA